MSFFRWFSLYVGVLSSSGRLFHLFGMSCLILLWLGLISMLFGYLCGLSECVCLNIFCMFVGVFFKSDFLTRMHDDRVSVSLAFRILRFLKCSAVCALYFRHSMFLIIFFCIFSILSSAFLLLQIVIPKSKCDFPSDWYMSFLVFLLYICLVLVSIKFAVFILLVTWLICCFQLSLLSIQNPRNLKAFSFFCLLSTCCIVLSPILSFSVRSSFFGVMFIVLVFFI